MWLTAIKVHSELVRMKRNCRPPCKPLSDDKCLLNLHWVVSTSGRRLFSVIERGSFQLSNAAIWPFCNTHRAMWLIYGHRTERVSKFTEVSKRRWNLFWSNSVCLVTGRPVAKKMVINF